MYESTEGIYGLRFLGDHDTEMPKELLCSYGYVFHASDDPKMAVNAKKAVAILPRPSGSDPYGDPWDLIESYLYFNMLEWIPTKWVRSN